MLCLTSRMEIFRDAFFSQPGRRPLLGLGHGAASKVSPWLSGKDGGKDGVEMRGVGGLEKKTMTGLNNTIFSAAGVVSCSLNSLLFSCGFFTVKQLAYTAGGGVLELG